MRIFTTLCNLLSYTATAFLVKDLQCPHVILLFPTLYKIFPFGGHVLGTEFI